MSNILYIVMPAFNEEANIENVIRAWYPLLSLGEKGSSLVVAYAGSTDNTEEILLGLSQSMPSLKLIKDTNRYHGPKLMALYNYAIENGADYIFQTDSDGQTNPEEFQDFWEKRKDFSAIIGFRPSRGDGIIRKFIEKMVCMLLRLYFSIKAPDANAPFRLMEREALARYIGRMPKDYALPNIMLTTFFLYYEEKVSFMPISFAPRRGSRSTLNIRKIIGIGIKALGEFRAFRKQMKGRS